MAVTLAQLKIQVQQNADLEADSHVGAGVGGELETRVNYGYRELWNLIRRLTRGKFFKTTLDQTVAAGQNTLTMPASFGRVLAVFRRSGTTVDDVERLRRVRLGELPVGVLGYDVLNGNVVEFYPGTAAPGNYRIVYEAKYTKLTAGIDMDARLEEWEEYVAVAGAIGAAGKQDRTTEDLWKRRAELTREITALVSDQSTEPDEIEDVEEVRLAYPLLPLP